MEYKLSEDDLNRIAVENINQCTIRFDNEKPEYKKSPLSDTLTLVGGPTLMIYVPGTHPEECKKYENDLARLGITRQAKRPFLSDKVPKFDPGNGMFTFSSFSGDDGGYGEYRVEIRGFSEIQKLANAGVNVPCADLFRTPGQEKKWSTKR